MADRKAVTIYVGDAKSLVAASAEAKAAIKSVQDQANKKSGLDKLPQLGGNITTGLAAAIPVVTGLSGALGGLAASATAAAGGAGAVAVGGIGALVVGLGSIAAVVKPAVANFQKVTTALDAYNLTLAKHGVTAKQATAAQQKLNAVVGQNGGADVLKAAKSWDALGQSFQKLTGPATSTMFKTFNDGLGALKSLLPTVAGIANRSMAALSKALQGPLKMLSGAEFKGILKSLGDTFAQSIGPGIKAASLVFLGFSRIAQVAGPYVVEFTKALEGMAQKFASATGNTAKLEGAIAFMVSNTKSWGALIKAVGKLLFDIFKQGVSSGQGMVDSLTAVVNKWDAWAKSVGGSQKISQFFQNSARFTKELASALGPVVKAMSVMSTGALPVYISLMSKLKGVMGPLTYAFVAYKVALLGATAATKAAEAVGAVRGLFGGGAGAAVAGGAAGTAARTAAGASSVEAAAAGAVGAGARIGLGTIAIGATAAYIGISALSKAINGDGGVTAGLKKMQTEMNAAISSGNTAKLAQLSSSAQQMGDKLNELGVKGGSAYKTLGSEAANAAHQMTTSFGQMSRKLDEVAPQFKAMSNDAGLSLNKILTQAKASGSAIASTLGTKSNDARVALAQNFSIAAQDVRASMQAGVINTGQGMKAIATLIGKALSALGGKPLAVSNFLADVGPGAVTAQQLGNAGALSQGGLNSPHAGGGYIGMPGEKGRDTVPIVVGRGEAVLNHDQQRVVNGALSAVGIGGLPSLFSRVKTPHYMAGGGFVQAPGTNYSVGQEPQIAADLNRMGKALGIVLTGISGYRSPAHSVAVGGFSNDPHTRGDASDTLGTQNIPEATLERFGLTRPFGGAAEADHMQLFGGKMGSIVNGAGAVGKAIAAVAERITAPKVSGTGLMSQIVRGALGKVTAAANAKLQKQSGGMFSGKLKGSAEHMISQFFGAADMNKIAIAGLIGNAVQESSLNWNTPGGGMWQQISNFGAGAPSPLVQMTTMLGQIRGLIPRMNAAGTPGNAAVIFEQGFEKAGIPALGNRIAAANAAYAQGYGGGGFVGSYKNGGVAPRDGFAYVHKGETMIPAFASGGIAKGVANNPILTAAAGFLYPLDEALAKLAAEIAKLSASNPANHNKEIAGLNSELAVIRREKINPPQAHNAGQITALQGQLSDIRQQRLNAPAGKGGNAERKRLAQDTLNIEQRIKDLRAQDSKSVSTRRKDLANQTLTIEEKVKKLKGDDSSARKSLAATIKGLNIQQTNLSQLKTYTDAITSLRTQMNGLAQQAAQAWAQVQTTKINAAHTAAINAIAGGSDATTLAAMQAQDTANANAQQLAGLQGTLTTDQALAAHSGGQTHVNALAQVQADQAAIDAFNRQQTENQLQTNIDAATKKADDAQTIALNGLDQQTADYQAGLDAQFAALTNSLKQRKLSYAQWAADVNAILAPYGLSAATDPTTEQSVASGPGPAGAKAPKRTVGWGFGKKPTLGGHRAGGGPVQPGYVYRVGENGPEDVVFGRSGTVLTAAQSRGSGGPTVHIAQANFTGTRAARAFADRLAYRAAIGTA